MTHHQRAAWLAVLLVTLVVCGFLIPQLPGLGDDTIALQTDTRVGMATASVTIPAGWNLDIEASSQQVPRASLGDVTVSATDAVWLGDSADLLANVSSLYFDGDAILPDTTDAAGSSTQDKAARAQWQLTPNDQASAAAPARVDVVRSAESVVVVVVRGPASDVAAHASVIDTIVDSVDLQAGVLDVEAGA